eukprot:1107-Heterococcus_DN1.PRE.5
MEAAVRRAYYEHCAPAAAANASVAGAQRAISAILLMIVVHLACANMTDTEYSEAAPALRRNGIAATMTANRHKLNIAATHVAQP